MKLPDDPKARNQILVLIGIFGLGALYGLYMGMSTLLLKPQKEKENKIASLTEKLEKADTDIDMMPMLEENNLQYIATIKEISDNYILHPQLGNYLIPAEEFIRKQEKASECYVMEVKEIGINTFPDPKSTPPTEETPVAGGGKKEWAFKIYTARVEIGGGYHNAVKLAKQIESANPFVCISAIKIAPNDETPFQHNMIFDVQWPIWNQTKATAGILKTLDSTPSVKALESKTAETRQPKKTADSKTAKKVVVDDSAAIEGLNKLGVNINEN